MSERLLAINVSRGGRPAAGAGVTMALVATQPPGKRKLVQKATGPTGGADLYYNDSEFTVEKVTVAALNYWTVSIERPSDSVNVALQALPKTGPLGWWHRALNITQFSLHRGKGIKIGILDEGVGPHPALRHIRNLGCMEGVMLSLSGGEDMYGHGTHVAGIIAARPQKRGSFGGITPGAAIVAIKVRTRQNSAIAQSEASLTQDSLAEALEMLVKDEKVDLVNLSLGASEPSKLLGARIKEAFDQGVLCICAAGNDGQEQIRFPAAYEESIAVASIGKANCGTVESPPAGADQGEMGKDGFFFARSSNYGTNIACCAPGIQIISTALKGAYADMSGTSMAAPAACAVLAARLAADRAYAKMPRDIQRAKYARSLLEKCCADIGLPRQYQGNGLIQA